MCKTLAVGFITLVITSCGTVTKKEYLDPEERWAELYKAVDAAGIFEDPKLFWDAKPMGKDDKILALYETQKNLPDFKLTDFIEEYFEVPAYTDTFTPFKGTLEDYVSHTFKDLITRPKDDGGSLVPTRMRYLSGGGKFAEYNSYTSFFAVKAFQSIGEDSLAADMATNAFQFIQDYGYVPYGNRSYYLGFKGFPILGLMAEAVAETNPDLVPWFGNLMARDYQNWMSAGDQELPSKGPYHSVVVLEDGKALNRHFNDHKGNRYVSLLKTTEWEGTSRFRSSTEQAPEDFLPIDLNAALYHFETMLSASFTAKKRPEYASSYAALGEIRKSLFNRYLFDPAKKFYYDFNFVTSQSSEAETLAAVYPLLTGLSNEEQAQGVAQKIADHFLTKNGVVNDLSSSIGTAEMNYLTILALRKIGQHDLANQVKKAWLEVNRTYFAKHGHILAAYDLADPLATPKAAQRIDGAIAVLTALINESQQ